MKAGLYEFDADAGLVRVFDGKAEVSLGPNADKLISVKGGHLLALNGDSVKPQSFNKKKSTDELTAWSDLRSQYVGQENAGLVQSGGGGGYGNAFGPGGYDLGFGSYPWFPGYGGFYSPFGLGLYSSFYGGGFGYPGLGYGFGGYPGYGFGGLGYGYGGGGGYGYVGGARPYSGLGYRGGYSGQFGNRGGTGRPVPGQGSSAGLRGMSRSSGSGPSQSANAGGFHGGGAGAAMSHGGGGGGGGAAMSHGGGGGSHR